MPDIKASDFDRLNANQVASGDLILMVDVSDTSTSASGKTKTGPAQGVVRAGGGVETTRTISTTAPLAGGGDLSADRTLTITEATTEAPGAMSAADKLKLNGIESGATADQTAAEVPFTPDGDLAATNVQNAIVELRNDTDTKLGAKADLAGQLGGSAASPDVRGLRETSGPTLLTIGGVADGEYLVRVGSTLVGGAPSGGGGLPSVNTIEGFGAGAQGYTRGSDPLAALAAWTAVVVFQPLAFLGGLRQVFGTEDEFGSGGFAVCADGESVQIRYRPNSGGFETLTAFSAPMVRRTMMVAIAFDASGSDTVVRFALNGGVYAGPGFVGGVSGTYTAGGNLVVGSRNGVDRIATSEKIHGAGWANRALSFREMADWYEECRAAGQLEDIPSGGGLSEGWRVGGSAPGATWAPFVGSADLTRIGSALTHREIEHPQWK